MERKDISPHPVDESMSESVRRVRTNDPRYFLSLIEAGLIENIDSISDLSVGSLTRMKGMSSACYFLKDNQGDFAVKFRPAGIDAEAETLNVWRLNGVTVPEIKGTGVVTEQHSTKYLLLEGIVDKRKW